MEVRLLGPFLFLVNGRDVTPTAGRLRTLLAVLAMSAGAAVTTVRLAEELWGDDSPVDAGRSLRTYVTRLRAVLGAGVISTEHGGYRLECEPDRVDALRLMNLVATNVTAPDSRRHLAAAAGLWRGEPFSGIDGHRLIEEERPKLTQAYLSAVEQLVTLDLADGHAGILNRQLSVLTALAERHPTRESLWTRLIQVLHRLGRHEEARECFALIKARLADDLGADPGAALSRAAAELSTPQTALATVVPRQLPAVPAGFTGRQGELEALTRFLEEHEASRDGMLVVALHGSGGTGKTTLAVRWAHEVADRFPDGQLFLNLCGYGPGQPVEPAEALDTMLRGLGVSGDAIPPGIDARGALLRSTLASRRVLIVLDNARSAEQVRPLLPGPGVVVLVTSRTQLRGLAARDGARRIQVARLLPTESRTMLGKLLTSQGTAYDEADLVQLAEACAHLPLALAIAAERAGRYPGIPISESIARLQDAQDRLGAFDSGDDDTASLRAVFAMSYDALDPAAARMFRLLGVHPGCDVSAAAAAALASVPVSAAARLLDVLSDVNMVDQRPGGRYEQHDLLREYAGELVGDAERDQASERLACWYIHSSINARHQLDRRPNLSDFGEITDGVTPLTFADEGAALTWYDAEYRSLVAMAESSLTAGRGLTTARIVHSLNAYLVTRWYLDEALELQTTALTAAQAAGQVMAEAVSCQQIGGTCFQRGQYAESEAWIRRAVTLFDEIGDAVGRCVSQAALGLALQMSGQLDASIETLEDAFRTADALQLGSVAANARNNLAWAYIDAGRAQEATEAASSAAAYYRSNGERRGVAVALDTLGYALAAQGQHADAVIHFESSVQILRDLGRLWTEAAVLRRLGDSYAALRQQARARECWLRALRIVDEIKADDISELSRSELVYRLGGWLHVASPTEADL